MNKASYCLTYIDPQGFFQRRYYTAYLAVMSAFFRACITPGVTQAALCKIQRHPDGRSITIVDWSWPNAEDRI